MTKSTLKA